MRSPTSDTKSWALVLQKIQMLSGIDNHVCEFDYRGNRGIDGSLCCEGEDPSLLVSFAGRLDPGFVRQEVYAISEHFLRKRI